MIRRLSILAAFVATPTLADVIDSESGGFTTRSELRVEAPRDEVWQKTINEIDQWWNAEHTISGDASRLTIQAVPQGCFCEVLGEQAGVVHLTVTMVSPGVVIRLTGGLGPLGLMGVEGNMTWEFETVAEGTRVTFTYAVGGYRPGGLTELAEPVDAVIADALSRLKAHVEHGRAETTDID